VRLKDKVAIITGAGRGIGRAYALGFANEGAMVVVTDIIMENAQKVAQEIEAKGGKALGLHVDVSSETDTQTMAERTVNEFGKIDILVNNAAVYYGLGFKTWDSWTTDDWDKIYAVNVKGVWVCTKAVAPFMIKQGKGKVIDIASTTFNMGFAPLLPYTCSKGAVIALTRCLARALGSYGINVNCISPGFTMSEASIEMPGKPPEADQMVTLFRCIRRSEQPDDLVGTAIFLASDDSDFVTGQTIVVDGGDQML
jgi:3-oxoacyl-[acyl-carrier protein] reductase